MKKKQLHVALAVLLTKLSSARDNPLLMDNYVTKALRTVLLEFKESGELYAAYKEQIHSTMESDNPWIDTDSFIIPENRAEVNLPENGRENLHSCQELCLDKAAEVLYHKTCY